MRAVVIKAAILGTALALAATTAWSATIREDRPAPGVAVRGDVRSPRSFSVADLQALPGVTETVSFHGPAGIEHHTETGPLLTTVIAAAGGLDVDPAVKNDKLRHLVLATGLDGYGAVVSWGEIDASFAGTQVIVAWAEDGKPLSGTADPARLVVPSDQAGGRYVSSLVRLEVKDADPGR
jgi:DMSO/TMAO reductase YedYZ molybdopterin-dependent catalytic subunit